MTRYWAGAEDRFWEMVDNDDYGSPDNRFIRVAIRAFEHTTSQHEMRGPRIIRAVEKARGGISASWDRAEPDPAEADSA